MSFLCSLGAQMHEYKARVNHIVDGDTIDVDIDLGFNVWLYKQRIRLYGVDTPESRTRDLVEKRFGKLAKSIIEQHCPVGTIIVLRTKMDSKSVGKYGRVLGTLIVNELNINEYLVNNNYAVQYTGQHKDTIHQLHLDNRKVLVERGEITVDNNQI